MFSILFHKNFYYYPLIPDAQGHVDSRIDSLLTRLGIEGRAITTKEQLSSVITTPYKPIDWDSVDAKREEFVQVGKDFRVSPYNYALTPSPNLRYAVDHGGTYGSDSKKHIQLWNRTNQQKSLPS